MSRPALFTVLGALGLVGVGSSLVACDSSSSDVAADTGSLDCNSASSCGSGALCRGGHCEVVDVPYKNLIIEVLPAVSKASDEYGGQHYLLRRDLPVSGVLPLELETTTEFQAAMQLPKASCAKVAGGAELPLPIVVELHQSPEYSGIHYNKVFGTSSAQLASGAVVLRVSPGKWDLYVRPVNPPSGEPSDCTPAPFWVRRQQLAAGVVSWVQRFPTASLLDVDVVLAKDAPSLETWRLDMIEPLEGRALSAEVTLGAPSVFTDGSQHHQLRLAYGAVSGAGSTQVKGQELLRLRPGKDDVGPTYYVVRSTVDLFGTGSAVFNQIQSIPRVVEVQGRVQGRDDRQPVRAQLFVTARPTSSKSTNGLLSSFSLSVDTKSDGSFSFKTIAGALDVVVVPTNDSGYATSAQVLEVSELQAVQAGKLLRVTPGLPVSGQITLADGSPAPLGTLVQLTPSASAAPLAFRDALLAPSVRAERVITVNVDSSGRLSSAGDSGTYDLSARPPDSSGLPWGVRSAVVLKAGSVVPGPMALAWPWVLGGVVTVPGPVKRLPLADAIVRAYVRLDGQGRVTYSDTSPKSLMPIAETRSLDDGSYQLLLPPEVQ